MPKFFIKREDIDGDTVVVRGDNQNHIKNVFRFKVGDEILLCDGEGTDYKVKISSQTHDYTETKILEVNKANSEPSVNITLYQGVPKATKLELIIQKNVELGINKIVPVMCERTIVRFNNQKDIQKKVERWQKIAKEASKQSGRGIIPEVRSPITLKEAINNAKEYDLAIIPYEKEHYNTLKDVLSNNRNAKNICVFIGPEGGFSEQEIELCNKNNIIPITLGNRILRTETASMYTTSIIMYELD